MKILRKNIMAENQIVLKTKEEELPSFIKKKHELDAVIKKLEAGSKEAAELLINIANDEKADLKLRKDCAVEILTTLAKMTEQRSKDQMNRMIAEIKIRPGGASKTLKLEEDKQYPVLDFNTVREI